MDEQPVEQIVQQIPIDAQPYPNQYNPFQQDTANLVRQINPDALIEQVEHTLRGEAFDFPNQNWIVRWKCLLNDEGVSSIITILRSVVNQNTTLSNLTENEVSSLVLALGDELVYLLRQKYQKFGVDKANLRTIVNLICRMAYFALKRGFMEGDKRFLRTIIRSHESNVMTVPKTPDSIFSKFNPMR